MSVYKAADGTFIVESEVPLPEAEAVVSATSKVNEAVAQVEETQKKLASAKEDLESGTTAEKDDVPLLEAAVEDAKTAVDEAVAAVYEARNNRDTLAKGQADSVVSGLSTQGVSVDLKSGTLKAAFEWASPAEERDDDGKVIAGAPSDKDFAKTIQREAEALLKQAAQKAQSPVQIL